MKKKEFLLHFERQSRNVLCAYAGVSLLLISMLSIVYPLNKELSEQSLRINFEARTALGKEPKLDSHLKVLVYDDSAAALIRQAELPLDGWTYALKKISERPLKHIYIDKIFAFSSGKSQLPKFVEQLKTSPIPITLGASCRDKDVPGLQKVDQAKSLLQLNGLENVADDILPKCRNFYGPDPEIASAVASLGLISLAGKQEIYPFVMQEHQQKGMTSFALRGSSIRFHEKYSISIDGQSIGLDQDGKLLINLLPKEVLFSRMKSMNLLFKDGPAQDEFMASLNPDDVLLILPQNVTGLAEFKETIRGTYLGGMLHMSLLNSVLQSEWLSVYATPWYLTLALWVLGAALGIKLKGKSFWFFIAVLFVLLWSLSVGLFVFQGLHVNWILLSCILAISAFGFYAVVTYRRELLIKTLVETLGVQSDKNSIEALLAQPHLLIRPPEEREMSILFLDMVGFSILSDKQEAKEVFQCLKSLFKDLEKIIHEHGGMIDKILGDGLLCFFGHSEQQLGQPSRDHCERALCCALELQRWAARSLVHDGTHLRFPFRIGINTAKVHFGDLGGDDRIEYTCIGQGVNYAARLETGCQTFCVLLSEESWSQLHLALRGTLAISEKLIQIKHYHDFFKTYEVDPFASEPELYEKALAVYRQNAGIVMKYVRTPVRASEYVVVNTSLGTGELLDFSMGGLCLDLKKGLFGKSVVLEVSITLQHSVQPQHWSFVAEIKNSYGKNGRAMHGVEFKNLSKNDALALNEALSFYK